MTWKYYEKSLHWIWRQSKDLCRRQEDIGFQNFLVTYWPSSWLRPFSLCGEVTWSWISNAFVPFAQTSFINKLQYFTFSQSNPAVHIWKWLEIPVKSHSSSQIVFLCCSILVKTFIDASPTYFLPHLQLATVSYTHLTLPTIYSV